jgi:hypothetical protein
MDKCKEITFCAKELLKTHKIHISDNHRNKVVILVSKYMELLIFNIVAVISIICLNIGIKKVLSLHMQYISKYIDKRCSDKAKNKKRVGMRGGAFNTAAFYGVAEPNYSKDNDTSDLLKIDFDGGIARNAILMSGGGSGANKTPNCIKLDKIIAKKIRNVFKFFDIKFENNVIAVIKNKYDEIILNLLRNIRAIKGDITDKKVEQLILKSKIMKK